MREKEALRHHRDLLSRPPLMEEVPLLLCSPAPVSVGLRENESGASPRQPTQVRAWLAGEILRLTFDCLDTRPWATLTQRDGPLWTEEVVEVFIDPVGDGAGYFELEVNPLGTVCDLVLRRIASGWRREFGWDCEGLVAGAARTQQGWRAELAIPLLSLVNELPSAGSEWRINFHRIDRPEGTQGPRELSSWSPTFGPTFHDPRRFGRLRFAA